MTAFAAVVFFCIVRAVAAGYGGLWFFPVVAGEALNGALPFLAIAVAEWTLRRFGRAPIRRSGGLITVIEYVALFAYFGKGWVEPHTTIAELIGLDSRLNFPLVAVGLMFGGLVVRIGRLLAREGPGVVVWATAGFLIVGPLIYQRFDTVEAGARLQAALTIVAVFGVFAMILAAVVRGVGERGFRVGQWAAVALAIFVPATLHGPPAGKLEGAAERPSVVVVLVDTLRADMLDETTGDGYLMPRLRELAARGVRFTSAVAPSPWTLPSTVSLLTGLSPYRHHAGRVAGEVALPGDPTLASYPGPAFRRAGYQVAGFFNNPYLRPYYGIGKGYLRYRRYHGNARDGVGLARSWVVRHRVRPFVLVLHLMDPHWPYQAPHGYGPDRHDCAVCDDLVAVEYRATSEDVRAEVRRRYLAEVAFTDAWIGRFVEALEHEDVADHTWIIVTADHGEEFWEHRRFLHGHDLFDEQLRIPLVIVPPAADESIARGVSIDSQVRLEDVGATVLDLAGMPMPPPASQVQACLSGGGQDRGCDDLIARMRAARSAGLPDVLDGSSLLDLVRGEPAAALDVRPAVAGFLRMEGSRFWAVRSDGYKLIVRPGSRWPFALYDLTADPGETKNLAFERPSVVGRLRSLPRALGLTVPAVAAGERPIEKRSSATGLDRDIARELRSLGYLQ